MPETAPLELRNRFGSVTVQKLRAPATINNGNGNVVLMQGSGRQRIENSFGNVEVITNDGDVTVVNGNGWVRASDISGNAEVTNRFGEVRITNVGKGLTVHGGNSKVEVEHVGGIAIVTTSFGDVRVWDAKSDLTVRNQNGRVEANTVAGMADLQTSFANVKFTGIGKAVRVSAQNSAVTGDTVGETATVQTSFANVDLRGVKGGARVTAGNAGIRMAGIGGEAYAKSSFAGITRGRRRRPGHGGERQRIGHRDPQAGTSLPADCDSNQLRADPRGRTRRFGLHRQRKDLVRTDSLRARDDRQRSDCRGFNQRKNCGRRLRDALDESEWQHRHREALVGQASWPVRLGERQRAQQHAAEDAENRRDSADAKRKRAGRGEHQPRSRTFAERNECPVVRSRASAACRMFPFPAVVSCDQTVRRARLLSILRYN